MKNIVISALLGLFLCQPQVGRAQAVSNKTDEIVVLPPSVPDPFEPVNRAMWSVNKTLLTDVIKPTARIYRTVVVRPVRTGIQNMGRNATYPDRLLNTLLQGKWRGVRDETYRFLYNSTVGLAGFFDVATKSRIPKWDVDFGQTFGQWGWKPKFFLMLPLLGPSNDRDALGAGADYASNPMLYFSPYTLAFEDPLTYTGPYSYFTYVVTYNNLSDTVNESVRFAQSEMDPYSELEYAWTFARANRVADFKVKGKQDEASLETLQSVFFAYKDPDFPNRAKTCAVEIPTTHKKLKFTYWLQASNAPVVYLVPGLGSHRLAETSMALAELVYKNGFTAVCVSSPFNAEFMEHASIAAMPAYLPVDGHDLHVALTAVDHELATKYPGRLGQKALMGYSMGAFDALYVAATEQTNSTPLLKFDRYVAVNTPVRLWHGVSKLDEFYQAPLQWPAAERSEDIENTFLKVADLSKNKVSPQTSLPFSAIESKFLVGLTFRFILRDIIYSSQERHNMGILRHKIRNSRRDPVYQEILHYSYGDYFDKFAVPYYQSRGLSTDVAEALQKAGDLRSYAAGLRANSKIRVIVNQNDFLLANDDLAWLRATFPPEELTVFDTGGHLGNLVNTNVQRTIVGALAGMKK